MNNNKNRTSIKDKNYIYENISKKRNGCWEWTRSKNPKGYGRASGFGKPWQAHRLSWFLFNGEIKGFHVLHKCDNPPCVNPKHLWLGTDKDNAKDREFKKRGNTGKFGEDSSRSILTESDSKNIFSFKGKLSAVKTAKKLGFSLATVSRIFYGYSWWWVTGQKRKIAPSDLKRSRQFKPKCTCWHDPNDGPCGYCEPTEATA